jgi:hypothetical protein
VPLAEKLEVGHLQFECVALENSRIERLRRAGAVVRPERSFFE